MGRIFGMTRIRNKGEKISYEFPRRNNRLRELRGVKRKLTLERGPGKTGGSTGVWRSLGTDEGHEGLKKIAA